MNKDISQIRKDYRKKQIIEADFPENPVQQFQKWFDEAIKEQVVEVNAMVLSTVNQNARPSSRVVLLKGIKNDCFLFYTNYESNKGKQLSQNPMVSLNFFWPELERQVRIEGRAEKVSQEISDTYFLSRPRDSKIGAWVSPQSEVLSSRSELEDKLSFFNNKFSEGEIPRPEHWGGYAVVADLIEFWQGGANRLHDRLRYRLVNDLWEIERLAP